MTLTEIFSSYLQFCYNTFMFDMEVFSKPWLYIPFLIPAFGYFMFFCIKWSIITMPLWLPLRLIFVNLFHFSYKKGAKNEITKV